MAIGIEVGFELDRRWRWMRGEMEGSKKPALLLLARILDEERVPYIIIGGVALQVHQPDPRTTLDLAVADPASVPRDRLAAAGFRKTGLYAHSENWVGPEGTPVQITADPALASAISRAIEVVLDGVPLRVIAAADLLREKLRAASDPSRPRSKRLQDLADAHSLVERDPSLASILTPGEAAILGGSLG